MKYYKLKVICLSQNCYFPHSAHMENALYILFKLSPSERLGFFYNIISDKEIDEHEDEDEHLEKLVGEEMKEFKELTIKNWKKPFGYVAVYNKAIVNFDI